MEKKGLLIVISGFSGAGKGTLVRALLQKYQEYALSVSMTTRAPRPGERDGIEYFFTDKEHFEETIRQDGLVEYAAYCGNYYGTPKAYVEEQLAAGKNVILEIEIQGALKIKEKFPESLLIFLTPPSAGELKKRLEGRGTETQEVIEKRLARAVEESEGVEAYDYIVVNDDLEECVEEVHRLVDAARSTCPLSEFYKRNQRGTQGVQGRRKIMLHPSYSDLMKVVNSGVEPGEAPVVNSRYSIVMATSKRARQIIAGEEPLVDGKDKKPLSVAIEELNQGKIKILGDEE